MSDEEKAFLLAIRERPYDDAPRLIFADWLDEHGRGEQAEFIRLQIDRAKKPLLRHNELHMTRERQLQCCFGHLWSEGLPQGLPRYFSRGFVDDIRIDHDAFLRQAEQIFSLHPIMRVTLHNKRPSDRSESDRTNWCWFNADYEWSGPHHDELHPTIFYRLPDSDASVYDVASFPTESAAIDAASFACVALGRKRAGLPPLEITAVNSTLLPASLPT